MGIEDREYLKDNDGYNAYTDGGLRVGSMSIVNKLIIATVAFFVMQLMTSRGPDSLIQNWFSLDSVSVFQQGQIWRLLTYAFCHSQQSLLHIVMNMYMLYMLGQIVCRLTGDREFLWFYLASAIFAGICSVAFYAFMRRPEVHIIGASGAVLAVFVLFAMHYPRHKMYIFGAIPVEVRWLLAIYIALDAWPTFQMLASNGVSTSNVAHSAHLGGALFGFLYFRWNMRFVTWWDKFAKRIPKNVMRRKNLKVFNPGIQPEPSSLSDSVDAILEKISREGESSLTTRERNILTQASRQLRNGRQ